MKELIEGKRRMLYGSGAVLGTILLLAGFVYEPGPDLSIEDLESQLAMHIISGDDSSAEQDIERILSEDSENLYASLMRAYLHVRADRLQEAVEMYKQTLVLASQCPELEDDIYHMISELSLRLGDYTQARHYGEERIRIYGENVPSRLIIALSSFLLEDDKNFEENLDRAMDSGVLDPAFKLKLASLIDDVDRRNSLFRRMLALRTRYERRPEELYCR
jgi:tetratricopeptide (TPR) repeat protein